MLYAAFDLKNDPRSLRTSHSTDLPQKVHGGGRGARSHDKVPLFSLSMLAQEVLDERYFVDAAGSLDKHLRA
jgi:hypothetical protein